MEIASEIHHDDAIRQDHLFVTAVLPPAAIITLTKEYVTVVIIRTAYSKLQLRVQYVENYPSNCPIIELSSPTLPMALLRTKEKECIEKASTVLGQPQLRVIYDHLYSFMHTNMFVSCWKEMKQLAALCEGKASVSVDEKEGLILLKTVCKGYSQQFKLKVPYMYPEEGLQIEFGASSFPQEIQYMYHAQACEVVRRCVAGISAEQATQLSQSTAPKLPPQKTSSKGEPVLKITQDNLKILKRDVNVLKQITDLRAATQSKGSHSSQASEITSERREARKELRRLAQSESTAEVELKRQLQQQEEEAMQQLLRCKLSDTALPSLLPAVNFLLMQFALTLPAELCQACNQPVLPNRSVTNPSSGSNSSSSSGSAQAELQQQRPMRAICGHWLHHSCLDRMLTTPPFGKTCSVCADQRRIWHPDWSEDPRQLEKAWQCKQARLREMADVSDFMGMS